MDTTPSGIADVRPCLALGRLDRTDQPDGRGEGGRRMNLVICSLDTLRADRLSCLGHGRGLDPESRPDRIGGRPVLPGVRHRHPDPAVTHRPVHRTVRYQHRHRQSLPPGRLSGRVHRVAALAAAPPRLHHRGGRPPVRHEGLVHQGLRRLHAPARAIPVPRIGDQRHRVPVDHRPRRRGLPPLLALLGRPHPLCPPVPVQGAVLPPDGRTDRPGHHRQARRTAELSPVQAEPVRLPRVDAQPRLHRRSLRRRSGLPRLRDRSSLRPPR